MNRLQRQKSKSKDPKLIVVECGRLYSFKETLDVLGMTAPTLRKYIRRGDIPASRLGPRWFIRGDDIRSALAVPDGAELIATANAAE